MVVFNKFHMDSTFHIPDHSLLTWCINFENSDESNKTSYVAEGYDKFDVNSIPHDFMTNDNILTNVNTAIADLEGSLRSQTDIDLAFNGWCELVKNEMYNRLPFRSVCSGTDNKKRRPGKPWWSNTLTDLWNSVCNLERRWLNCNTITLKCKLKSDYCHARKPFDREVQQSKRRHWYKLQDDILNEVDDNPNEF